MIAALVVAVALGVPTPAVRLTSPHPIAAMASVGSSLAYLDAKDCRVHVGSSVLNAPDPERGACAYDTLAVAGGSALWGGYREVKCSGDFWVVLTSPPGTLLENRTPNCGQGGDELTGIVSTGGKLFYSYVTYEERNDCQNQGGSCHFVLQGSHLVAVSGARKIRLASAPAALLLAGGGGRLALVRGPATLKASVTARPVGPSPFPPSGPLEVRDESGRFEQAYPLPAPAEALAVSASLAVAATVSGSQRTLRWFGARQGSLAIGAGHVLHLAVDDRFVVVETDQEVFAVDTIGGRRIHLASLSSASVAAAPGGVEALGGHALWIENSAHGGRILDAALG